MRLISLSWSDFKTMIANKNLALQCIEHPQQSGYTVYAIDGNVEYKCDLEVLGDDETDFETNYKSDSNKPIKPLNQDRRTIVHSTPRMLGTYSYFTGADDDHTDPHAVGGNSNIQDCMLQHTIGQSASQNIYMDFNTIINETYVRQGEIQWKDAQHDMVEFSFVPKVTTYSAGTNTNFNLYGGYLIIPAAGDGTISVSSSNMELIQCVPNEFGEMPAGYWDADWNTSTKQFDNITPNLTASGGYNMFGLEVKLAVFMHRRRLLGSGHRTCNTDDISRVGHGMRLKVDFTTVGTDHAWEVNSTLMLYRMRTV